VAIGFILLRPVESNTAFVTACKNPTKPEPENQRTRHRKEEKGEKRPTQLIQKNKQLEN